MCSLGLNIVLSLVFDIFGIGQHRQTYKCNFQLGSLTYRYVSMDEKIMQHIKRVKITEEMKDKSTYEGSEVRCTQKGEEREEKDKRRDLRQTKEKEEWKGNRK